MLRMSIRQLRPEDWPQVEQIYRDRIDAGNATFETDPPSIFPENTAWRSRRQPRQRRSPTT
jgi:L-amino acid N-acyltransferase YncA